MARYFAAGRASGAGAGTSAWQLCETARQDIQDIQGRPKSQREPKRAKDVPPGPAMPAGLHMAREKSLTWAVLTSASSACFSYWGWRGREGISSEGDTVAKGDGIDDRRLCDRDTVVRRMIYSIGRQT
ncbi:hypothetical protein TEQG_02043 [Trichophyton equinum CBS 127.97]|uniref:Uncharacterized protein n=1 Tax=Trichophyton equinum (strain ATCC MYA-4606 / CBS 127.97) TaxID=559882 RepID=F2PMA9_TRIEC|nr:hypothetical protein TEQG_02043 [Trichophyton equinum CBS 127.97]